MGIILDLRQDVCKLSTVTGELGLTNATEHVIELVPGITLIKQRYYRVSPMKQKIIDEENAAR